MARGGADRGSGPLQAISRIWASPVREMGSNGRTVSKKVLFNVFKKIASGVRRTDSRGRKVKAGRPVQSRDHNALREIL